MVSCSGSGAERFWGGRSKQNVFAAVERALAPNGCAPLRNVNAGHIRDRRFLGHLQRDDDVAHAAENVNHGLCVREEESGHTSEQSGCAFPSEPGIHHRRRLKNNLIDRARQGRFCTLGDGADRIKL